MEQSSVFNDTHKLYPNVTCINDGNDEYPVPNIVHYIWYHDKREPLKFHHMISVLTTYQQTNPDTIYFYADNEPIGEYWDRVKAIPTLKLIHRNFSRILFNQKLPDDALKSMKLRNPIWIGLGSYMRREVSI